MPWPLIVMGVWLALSVAWVLGSWLAIRHEDKRAARIDRDFCRRYGVKL